MASNGHDNIQRINSSIELFPITVSILERTKRSPSSLLDLPIIFHTLVESRNLCGRKMGEAEPLLHFLFVSFPAQGHVNPLLRLAKRVAAKGPLVTFSTTLDSGRRIRAVANGSVTSDAETDSFPVGRGLLRFEFFDHGADPSDPNRDELNKLMFLLDSNGPGAIADLIRRQSDAGRPVSCVVNNPFLPWVLDVAADFSIPSAVLWVQSCAVFSTYFHYHHRLADFPNEQNPNVTVHLPGLPPLRPEDLPNFLMPSNPYKPLIKVILAQFQNMCKARWVFANSFEELERDTFKAMAELTPVNVIPVGPLVDAGEPQEIKIKADL
ncbi:hypothetical protein HPP92_004350 [Vanilla planifolia]|uniref:Glycosyltransferase N-terminal domain-containing protein n=1 Tax=Vanilla planifolia TaxID=51239 RepID=A0A835RJN2_VANPL|nr:hypothetical protein HPP92_004350 [Vanilla planifolia]